MHVRYSEDKQYSKQISTPYFLTTELDLLAEVATRKYSENNPRYISTSLNDISTPIFDSSTTVSKTRPRASSTEKTDSISLLLKASMILDKQDFSTSDPDKPIGALKRKIGKPGRISKKLINELWPTCDSPSDNISTTQGYSCSGNISLETITPPGIMSRVDKYFNKDINPNPNPCYWKKKLLKKIEEEIQKKQQ